MPWGIRTLEDSTVVELCYRGEVSPDELRASARQAIEQVSSFEKRLVLADCRELTGGHSIADLYELAGDLARLTSPSRIAEAVVLPRSPMAEEHARFWATVGANRGFVVQTFRERDEALAWLCQRAFGSD